MAKLVAGGILILVALFMLLGFFNANSEMSGPARVGTFLFLVVLPAAIGGLLVKLQFKSQRAARDSAEEQRRRAQEADILKLARREGGKLRGNQAYLMDCHSCSASMGRNDEV